MPEYDPKRKSTPFRGGSGSSQNTWYFWLTESKYQTPSWSVQPFLEHSTLVTNRQTDTQTDTAEHATTITIGRTLRYVQRCGLKTTAYLSPSCLQTTTHAASLNRSSHTVPHVLLCQTSSRPSELALPAFSRTGIAWPLENAANARTVRLVIAALVLTTIIVTYIYVHCLL